MKTRVMAFRDAVWIMFRVWRLSRRTGIPFQPLLEAHLEAMRNYTVLLGAVSDEIVSQEVQRQAAEQAPRN